MSELALVAAESGSPWMEWADSWAGDGRELVVVLQQRDESPADFQVRVEQSLRRALRRDSELRELVVLPSCPTSATAPHQEALLAALTRATAEVSPSPQVSLDTRFCKDRRASHSSLTAAAPTSHWA